LSQRKEGKINRMEKLPVVPLAEIKKIPLFQGIAENDLSKMVQAAHRKHLSAGEFFYLQGDPAECMYVLLKGRVKLSKVGQDGQQALIRVITPVTLFALVAMTPNYEYPVTSQAAEDCQTIYWTQPELMEFMIHIPHLAQNAMRILAEQLQEIQERFRQATAVRVEQRLAHTLIRLAAQSGKKVEQGILIDLTLTRQDLAEMSGTTLYTASRVLSQWEEQSLVISRREQVIIRDIQGLEKIAEDSSG
jgi:CRP-like cAMP-binding protein